jgi:hypothetical protein
MARFFNEPEEVTAEIVFATHQVFPHIPYIAKKRDWHILIDEELQVVQHACHRVPKTHAMITDDIELETYNSLYSRVTPRNRASLERKGRNKENDELLAPIAETIRRLNNDNWLTYVNTQQYERLRSGKIQTLAFHSLLNPKIIDGFGSVFMGTANFEDTAIFQLWNDHHCLQNDEEFLKIIAIRISPKWRPDYDSLCDALLDISKIRQD